MLHDVDQVGTYYRENNPETNEAYSVYYQVKLDEGYELVKTDMVHITINQPSSGSYPHENGSSYSGLWGVVFTGAGEYNLPVRKIDYACSLEGSTTSYPTFKNALEEAPSGSTLILSRDINEDGLVVDKDITIKNTSGKSYKIQKDDATADIFTINSGTVKFNGVSIVAPGTAQAKSNFSGVVVNGGLFQGMSASNITNGYINAPAAPVLVNRGELYLLLSSITGNTTYGNTAALVIDGGSVTNIEEVSNNISYGNASGIYLKSGSLKNFSNVTNNKIYKDANQNLGKGAGIYVEAGASIILNSSSRVYNNVKENNEKSDIYLNDGAVISLRSNITDVSKPIYIEVSNNNVHKITDYSSYNFTDGTLKFTNILMQIAISDNCYYIGATTYDKPLESDFEFIDATKHNDYSGTYKAKVFLTSDYEYKYSETTNYWAKGSNDYVTVSDGSWIYIRRAMGEKLPSEYIGHYFKPVRTAPSFDVDFENEYVIGLDKNTTYIFNNLVEKTSNKEGKIKLTDDILSNRFVLKYKVDSTYACGENTYTWDLSRQTYGNYYITQGEPGAGQGIVTPPRGTVYTINNGAQISQTSLDDVVVKNGETIRFWVPATRSKLKSEVFTYTMTEKDTSGFEAYKNQAISHINEQKDNQYEAVKDLVSSKVSSLNKLEYSFDYKAKIDEMVVDYDNKLALLLKISPAIEYIDSKNDETNTLIKRAHDEAINELKNLENNSEIDTNIQTIKDNFDAKLLKIVAVEELKDYINSKDKEEDLKIQSLVTEYLAKADNITLDDTYLTQIATIKNEFDNKLNFINEVKSTIEYVESKDDSTKAIITNLVNEYKDILNDLNFKNDYHTEIETKKAEFDTKLLRTNDVLEAIDYINAKVDTTEAI